MWGERGGGCNTNYNAVCFSDIPRRGVLQIRKLIAQGYQRFPLSMPVVGQNIALDAVSASRASIPT